MATLSTLMHLECSMCTKSFDAKQLINMCPTCQSPLFARYNLEKAKETMTPKALKERTHNTGSLWRYEEVLPIQQKDYMLSLGEGWTMLHHAKRLGDHIGCPNTFIKDEGTHNATGSFKARGLSVAVSRAYELGAKALSVPSAGNAAGATAAYAAAAGLQAHVYMPQDVPLVFRVECEQLGAHVTLVDGLINDCGQRAKRDAEKSSIQRFDLSTLKEPYRLEGKKTMGYELAEQLDWKLPDVIIYPTGGGTGLVGMWKAFSEMKQMGLLDGKRPRMVSVQSTGCAPIIRAFQEGKKHAEPWENAKTCADGLRVPVAVGDFLILDALRESGGTAVAVDDSEMFKYTKIMGSHTGIFPAPEGAACLAAQIKLLKSGWIKSDETVVLFNTGTGLKYFNIYTTM
ncbi:pyridoxal-phosphate dependent enzyme [Nitzschia inconspicua]|uniref:Pyridoxal-phosphate dependent enzyme n=1 Tax=Nitzschia inconspicua TaxID=303405 RepID=A0A9K3LVI1_9STRA|nr:pyridoxal-phosphate dependent enzyme [Nitzschia inconspicua]